MAGMLMTQTFHHQYRESSRLASEHAELLELIGDPTMTVGLLYGANLAKLEAGEAVDAVGAARHRPGGWRPMHHRRHPRLVHRQQRQPGPQYPNHVSHHRL
jgi:hypothetical protein